MGFIRLIRALLWIGLLACLPVFVVHAQGRADLGEVYVTTQDYSVLRAGPGQLWQRLAVLPPGTTLRATGRTIWGDWFQVIYEGPLEADAPASVTRGGVTYGWVAYWLLAWTGDILQLPVDGIQTVRAARITGPVVVIEPEMYYYDGEVDPSKRVTGLVTEPTPVEITGRIGSAVGGYFLLQFQLNGRYYWTASWEVGQPPGYFAVPNGAYLYSYGRLLIQLRTEMNRSDRILQDIGRRWRDLDAGYSVTCNAIPPYAAFKKDSFRGVDLEREAIYSAPVHAMESAVDNINQAIILFETVCARQGEERIITFEEVQLALQHIGEAEANLALVRTLLQPLERHDPTFDN